MILTTKTAQTALAFWQKKLRLQDWNITVHVSRQRHMPSPDEYNCAEVCADGTFKRATITLLDSVDFTDSDTDTDADMEDSLVHELLHLVLKDCRIRAVDNNGLLTAEGIAEERAVAALAAAFVGLHRKDRAK